MSQRTGSCASTVVKQSAGSYPTISFFCQTVESKDPANSFWGCSIAEAVPLTHWLRVVYFNLQPIRRFFDIGTLSDGLPTVCVCSWPTALSGHFPQEAWRWWHRPLWFHGAAGTLSSKPHRCIIVLSQSLCWLSSDVPIWRYLETIDMRRSSLEDLGRLGMDGCDCSVLLVYRFWRTRSLLRIVPLYQIYNFCCGHFLWKP